MVFNGYLTKNMILKDQRYRLRNKGLYLTKCSIYLIIGEICRSFKRMVKNAFGVECEYIVRVFTLGGKNGI